jgi:hypothetical protein
MTIPLRCALVGLVGGIIACGATQSTSIGGGKGEGTWREFKSQHFALRSDADVDDARASLAECETSYEALRSILFSGDRAGTKPVEVFLFAHGNDLRQFIPAGTVAVFIPQSSTMLLETTFNDEARRVFLHEMTHVLVQRSFPRVPLWLNEGLAEYFETMRIESGRVVLGTPVTGFEMSANQMPTLAALLRADGAVFYAGRAEHSVEGMYQQTAYYVAAWYLVHMLMHDKGDYRPRFHDFLDALKQGVPASEAWARTFDEATSRRLAHDYQEYLRTDSLDAGFVSIDVKSSDQVTSVDRVIPQEELRAFWTRLHAVGARR